MSSSAGSLGLSAEARFSGESHEGRTKRASRTAILIVRFQSGFIASRGLLRQVVDDSDRGDTALKRTVLLLRSLVAVDASIFSIPIVFSDDYRELLEPVRALATIRELGAVRSGTSGASLSARREPLGDRMTPLSGRADVNPLEGDDLDRESRKPAIRRRVTAAA